jgi:hypothetical protein
MTALTQKHGKIKSTVLRTLPMSTSAASSSVSLHGSSSSSSRQQQQQQQHQAAAAATACQLKGVTSANSNLQERTHGRI